MIVSPSKKRALNKTFKVMVPEPYVSLVIPAPTESNKV